MPELLPVHISDAVSIFKLDIQAKRPLVSAPWAGLSRGWVIQVVGRHQPSSKERSLLRRSHA